MLAIPPAVPALDWQDAGLCKETDPEMFFPERGASAAPALRVCAGCEVRAECLAYALDQGERFGVWGGMTERARRRLVRQRLRAAAAAVAGVPVPVEPAVPVAGAGEAA